MKNKKWIGWVAVACLVLAGCGDRGEKRERYDLRGAWIMTRIVPFIGEAHDYPSDGMTLCRLYEGDSVCYECKIETLKPDRPENVMTASDVSIVPTAKVSYTLRDISGGEVMYLEDGAKRPITFVGDSSIVIQRHGYRYTWVQAREMEQSRMEEMKRIIAHNLKAGSASDRFVLPTTEHRLKAANHTLIYLVIILVLTVLLAVHVTMNIYRKKRGIEQQLQQISEERKLRPQPVRQAMAEVEEEFLASEFYLSLRRRIAAGEMLKKEDWDEVEQQLRPVWPGFTNRLFTLCRMSELEYRVCLLIKLRVSPSEMAAVLSKDASSISTVRSRLYQKVFQRKGSSKDWDSFVLSL